MKHFIFIVQTNDYLYNQYTILKNKNMENLTVENKIEALKKKVNDLSKELETDIYTICENLDYRNSSRFSYNIDRLHQFKAELQDFNIIKQL